MDNLGDPLGPTRDDAFERMRNGLTMKSNGSEVIRVT